MDQNERLDYVANVAYQLISDLLDRAGVLDSPEAERALDFFSKRYKDPNDEVAPFNFDGVA